MSDTVTPNPMIGTTPMTEPDAANFVTASWERWLGMWHRLGSTAPEATLRAMYRQMQSFYSDPDRRYRTSGLLASRLALLDHLPDALVLLSPQPAALELALWMQDVIFAPDGDDAPARSAKWAALALRDAQVPDAATVVRVTGLITAAGDVVFVDLDAARDAAAHQVPGSTHNFGSPGGGAIGHYAGTEIEEGWLIRDMTRSLAWGLAPDAYDAFIRVLREEYAFLDEAAYRRGRLAVVTRLLRRSGSPEGRPATIFETEAFRHDVESTARANLERERQHLLA